MAASVCDISTPVPSRSRRISRDIGKRAARSLSRAASSRRRSKSRARESSDDPAFTASSRRYTSENTRKGTSCRPERRFEASEPSLHKRNSQESNVNRGRNLVGGKSVPPPPPRKSSIADNNTDTNLETAQKMNSSLGSADSNRTESTHPSTAYACSEHDVSLALVPYGGDREKGAPLPPSPKQSRRASRGDTSRLHRSHRESKLDESMETMSTRSESRLTRRDRRSAAGRSKSRSKHREDVYDSSFNESVEEVSLAKSRASRPTRRDQINLREAQRSLSRGARSRRKISDSGGKSARSKSKSRSVASVARSSRRSSGMLTKSKSAKDLTRRDESVSRRYHQIDGPGANSSTEIVNLKDSASSDNSSHRRVRSSMSSCSHKRSPPAAPARPSRSSSRPRSRRDDSSHHDSTGSDLLSNPVSSDIEETPVLNLVIDDTTGCGSFSVQTLHASITGCMEKHLQLFTVQLNEPSREFFIRTSMGHLHKIREIHPKTNILRTLSYWNGLQKRRYQYPDGHPRAGGQLGISKADSSNKHEVIMTLVGKYHNRDWEYDDDFHTELENFVDDALRFHACLNGLDESEVQEAQRKKKGMRLGNIGGSVTGSHMSGSRFGNASHDGSQEDWMGKKVLCKVLEKITG